MRRGLIFTLDMISSLFFFLVIVLAVLWLWNHAYDHMNDYGASNSRQSRILDISTALVTSGGHPENWEQGLITPSKVDALGLADEANVLSKDKIEAFTGAGYEDLRVMLGLGSEDFRFTVSRNYDSTPEILYDVGQEKNSAEARVAIRYALLEGERVQVKLTTYYDKI